MEGRFVGVPKNMTGSGNESSAHTLIFGVLESITCCCPVYWDVVADEMLLY